MKIKLLILLFSLFPYEVFAQAAYMDEVAEDANGSPISGIVSTILFGGIIGVIISISDWISKANRLKKQKRWKEEYKKKEEFEREKLKQKEEIEWQRKRNQEREKVIYTTKLSQLYSSWIKNDYEGVDLGLSVNWSPSNLGALSPENTGFHYKWGEVEKDRLSDNFQVPVGILFNIDGDIRYDAATKNIGNGWRIPTKKDVEELIAACKWEIQIQNNIEGYTITGINGNSIFLPCIGGRTVFGNYIRGIGMYWTSEAFYYPTGISAYYFSFQRYEEKPHFSERYRYLELPIRPVYDKKIISK